MATLKEFLHKFVDHVGAGSLHGDVDAIDDNPPEEKGEEESDHAAE